MDKFNLSIEQVEDAREAGNSLLVGARLCYFQTYSIVLNLCFIKLPKINDFPINIWLSVTGRAVYTDKGKTLSEVIKDDANDAFFDSRAELLGQIYRLIGKDVIKLDIGLDGTLELWFKSGRLVFARDEVDFEEIWSITSDTPEPYANHDWSITLTDEQQIVTKRPQKND